MVILRTCECCRLLPFYVCCRLHCRSRKWDCLIVRLRWWTEVYRHTVLFLCYMFDIAWRNDVEWFISLIPIYVCCRLLCRSRKWDCLIVRLGCHGLSHYLSPSTWVPHTRFDTSSVISSIRTSSYIMTLWLLLLSLHDCFMIDHDVLGHRHTRCGARGSCIITRSSLLEVMVVKSDQWWGVNNVLNITPSLY